MNSTLCIILLGMSFVMGIIVGFAVKDHEEK